MSDFLKFNDDISDEMLAAYIDGNATMEENILIEKVISDSDLLSETLDIVDDCNFINDPINSCLTNGDSDIFETSMQIVDDSKMEDSIIYDNQDYNGPGLFPYFDDENLTEIEGDYMDDNFAPEI